MRFLRGSKPRASERSVVAAALIEAGLKVDDHGNVRDGDFIIGSLDENGDFQHPVRYKNMLSVRAAKNVVHGMRRSCASPRDWKPNP